MSPIGETLRRERLKRNLALDQISRELKISARFLEAIEDERFDRLPAGVFARSFVRQYADLLGLDGEELAAELQGTLAPAPPAGAPAGSMTGPSRGYMPDIRVPRVEQWEAVGDRRAWSSSLPAFAMVVVVMLVCSGIYALWQRSRRAVAAHEVAPPVATAQPQPMAPAPAQGSSAQPSAPPPPAAAPAKPENNSADRPAPETAAPPAPAPPNTKAAPANPHAPVRVELTAAEPVWVLARADGKYLFSGTLEANQTRSVEASGVLLLRLGNAGGVNITLNGKPIGPVGPKGQVRDVQFTSGGFQIVAASKPVLPPADPL